MIFRLVKVYFIAIIASVIFLSCGCKKNSVVQCTTDSSATADLLAILDEKIKIDPKNADLYFQRSKSNLSMKHKTAAERDIKQALSLDSSKSAYYVQYGDVTFSNLNITQAEELFKKATELDSKNIDAYL